MPNNSPIPANPDSSSSNSIHSFQHALSQISGEGSAMKLSEYTDDEIRAEVNRLKNIYVEWKAYQQGARELMVQELQKNWVDIQHIEQEKQAWGAQREADINSLGAQVPGARELMNEGFRWMYTKSKDLLSAEVYERGWPTFEICQDLKLPGELVNLVLNPRIAGAADESRENDKLIQLRRLVKTLEDKLEAKTKKENSMTAIATSGQVKLSDEIWERRKRIHPPVFGGGSIQAAKDWIIEYKSVAEHLNFTQQERLDDMTVRFKNVALTWYSYLLPEVKNDWDSLERAFLEYFAGGENTLETALNELRNMRQGETQMSMFGQKLREVDRRAGIHNDKVLIGYLKQSVNPEMKRAIIYGGPTMYAAAVSISPTYSSTSGIPGVYGDVSAMAAQNYQDHRIDRSRGDKKDMRCFRSKKMGHMKKDCKVKLQDRQKQNQQVVCMSHQGEDVNIFSPFMNSQQEVNTKRQGRRFHIDIMADSGDELKALVDTGSTISSVSQVTARRLGLEPGYFEICIQQRQPI
ncbi:hypothetical protein G6F60_012482 [Rhizopus arrhizus]|nr:hypothetical protein G6F60_012482 [Rhizopus arrhizus]